MMEVIQSCENSGTLKEVYIAIDGVVPLAKIIQQRQRRFRSSHESFHQKTNWNSCLISPGTFFMNQFEKYLISFIRKHNSDIQSNKSQYSFKIILNSSQNFGEGEHKIMKKIRSLPQNTKIAIYGLDADLLILGITALRTHPNIHLFRENVHCSLKEFDKEDYLLVNIPQLWFYIRKQIVDTFETHQTKMRETGIEPTIFDLDDSRLILDFIVLTCYFGNDFLPTIPSVSLSLDDSIPFVLD